MRKYRSPKGIIPQAAPAQSAPVQFQLTGKAWWAIAIIALMVFSAVGYYYADRQDLAPGYRGFRFSLGADNAYLLKWRGTQIPFIRHPTELEQISVDSHAVTILQNSPQVLLTFESNSTDPEVIDTVRLRLAERFGMLGIALGTGVLEANSLYPFPIITCANATAYLPVLELRIGAQNGLSRNGNCLTLSGSENELAANSERLEYELLGVMV